MNGMKAKGNSKLTGFLAREKKSKTDKGMRVDVEEWIRKRRRS